MKKKFLEIFGFGHSSPALGGMSETASGTLVGSTNQLIQRADDGKWEVAQQNVEYLSNNQYDGIYGTVYRQYFGSTLPTSLTTGTPVSKLINGVVHFIRIATSVRYASLAWSDAGTGVEYFRLVQSNTTGNGPLVINSNGCTVISGWVDYTK